MAQNVSISREFFEGFHSIVQNRDENQARLIMSDLHPADLADLFEKLEEEDVQYLFGLLNGEEAADVLVEMEDEERINLLKSLSSEVIARNILDYMDSDDAADILADLEDHLQEEVLSKMEDIEQAGDIVDLLHYDEDSAGGLMAKEFIMVQEDWTVDQCISQIRKQVEEVDEVYFVYVVDEDEKFKGILSLKNLLIARASHKARDICNYDVMSVKTDMSSEEVASMMERYDLVALPVIDSIGRLVGRITIDDVVDVIREEAEKDYQMISGITEDIESSDRILLQTRARLPWLLVGLVGGVLGAVVIRLFEPQLATYTGLILFLPLIAAMAGNVGVQSSSIVVQGLASNALELKGTGKRLLRELGVSSLNGIILSVLIFLFNLLMNTNLLVTLSVSVALFAVIIFASTFGTLVPLLLDRYRIDPALATGPFITTTNDIMGLLIYFTVARILFGVVGLA